MSILAKYALYLDLASDRSHSDEDAREELRFQILSTDPTTLEEFAAKILVAFAQVPIDELQESKIAGRLVSDATQVLSKPGVFEGN